ncbi:MAG: replicative DNA helicase [Helicobacteraceae bacterium]|nr:replicative DNA helicase [Helicobacteraceae bacterium]
MEIELYNLNIERAVLSSILFESSYYNEAAERLNARDFYLPAHQAIFTVMGTLSLENVPIDQEFLKIRLTKENQYNEDAILDILATTPLSNTYAYIGEIKELATKRNMISLTTEIKRVIYEEQQGADAAIDSVQKRLFEIGVDSSSKQFRGGKEIVASALDRIKVAKERGNKLIIGLDTGFHGLNKMTNGFNNGDMIVLGARPSMGKTAFAMNLAEKILKGGNGVAIFSLEMSAEDLMLRLLSSTTSVSMGRIKTGDLSDEEWGRISTAADYYAHSHIFIDDDPSLTVNKMRSRLRRLKMQHSEIKFAIIDYIGLMGDQSRIETNRQQQISDISRGIKILARELDIPILVLCQLNRGLENREEKRPKLADIRESGSIEQDADIVMFVHREDVYKAKEEKENKKKAQKEGKDYRSEFKEKPEEEAEIIIEKHRNGATGTIKMIFQKAFTRFVDAEISRAEPIYYKDTNIQIEVKGAQMPPI